MSEEAFHHIVILLVEDNPGDVKLTELALQKGRILNTMYIAEDGEEAIEFLYHKGKWVDAPKPDLILLDLNLPRKNGLEVLKEIKSDNELKRIPVIILTTSKAEEDIVKSYDNHANCFITKPVDVNEFMEVIRTVHDFWITIVSLPKS